MSKDEYQAVDGATGIPSVQAIAVPETRVRVIAPSNLAAGYRLHVEVNGTPKTVIVVS